MMADVKRKVRSLLAVAAKGSGATGPEAATARALADKLMAEHGLEDDSSRVPARTAHTFTVSIAV